MFPLAKGYKVPYCYSNGFGIKYPTKVDMQFD